MYIGISNLHLLINVVVRNAYGDTQNTISILVKEKKKR